jgi:transposase
MPYILPKILKMGWQVVAKWRDDFIQQVHKLAQLGLNDAEIAHVFDVDINTLSSWKNKYPEFYDQLEAGRQLKLAEVASATFKAAIGYEYEETVTAVSEKFGTTITTYKKHRAPNMYAAKFILAARVRDKWTERSETVHTNINIAKLDLTQLSPEQLKLLETIQTKQLTEHATSN